MQNSNRYIKYGIWAYFFLLIFEGALRKWFLPGLATPLLIIRDPLVLWIFYQCWKKNLFPSNIYVNSMLIVGSIAILTAVFIGHGSLPVAIYGARGMLIHFPMVFIIGKIMNQDDVIKVGKMVLLIAIPMSVLIALQFYSPQSAWVNRGLGDDEGGAGFSGALGYFRPPGTFSFTLGVSTFFGLVASFVLYFWMNKKLIRTWLLVMATISLIMAIPLSISRGLFFQVVVSVAFLFIAVIRKPQYAGKIIMGAGIVGLALLILAKVPFFSTATDAFSARLSNAGEIEGGMRGTFVDRFLGEQTAAFDNAMTQPYFGYGLGMGTNAGSKLLTGNVQYLIAEAEWPRVIGEMGLLLGLIVLAIRISLSAKLFFSSLKDMQKGQLLPWMLLSFALIIMLNGNWAQPTALGFYALGAGLLMASLNKAVQYIPVYVLQEEEEEELVVS